MFKKASLFACSVLFASSLFAAESPHVLLTTSLGEIEIELDDAKAPISVANFLAYVDSGFSVSYTHLTLPTTPYV